MSGMTGNESQAFVFEVESGVLENENLPIRLLVKDINGTSWQSQIHLSISGAMLLADKVYVYDDPVFGDDILDPGETAEISIEISNILSKLNQEGQTIVMVTHNKELAKSSNKIFELKDGMLLN